MAKNVSSGGKVAGMVVSSNPAVLLSLTISNLSATAQYIQLHDAAAAPSNGAIPAISVYWPANTSAQLEWAAADGRDFSVGIYVCNSSTSDTKTLGAVDLMLDAQVRGA